jgi:phosphate/sulfate permease
VPGLRPPDDDPVRVGAPRPLSRAERPARRQVDPTDAGLVPLVLAALLAAGGAFAANKLFGAGVSGAIVGGVVGLGLGFVAIYKKYSDL